MKSFDFVRLCFHCDDSSLAAKECTSDNHNSELSSVSPIQTFHHSSSSSSSRSRSSGPFPILLGFIFAFCKVNSFPQRDPWLSAKQYSPFCACGGSDGGIFPVCLCVMCMLAVKWIVRGARQQQRTSVCLVLSVQQQSIPVQSANPNRTTSARGEPPHPRVPRVLNQVPFKLSYNQHLKRPTNNNNNEDKQKRRKSLPAEENKVKQQNDGSHRWGGFG